MKVFVIDLDGTLLSAEGTIEKEDVNKLISIQKAGNRIVLATGRNIWEAKQFVEALKISTFKGAVVLADGQYIEDYNSGECLERPFIKGADALKLCANVSSDNQVSLTTPSANYYVVDGLLSLRYLKLKLASLRNKHNKIINTKEIEDVDSIEKIVIDTSEKSDFLENYRDKFEIVYIHDKNRYEIKHKDVNKGESLKILLDRWNIPEDEVYVFGNDDNDISMMRVTRNSYSMDSGTESLKQQAANILRDSPSIIVNTIENILLK